MGAKGGCDKFSNTMSGTEQVIKEWLFVISHSVKATEYSVKLSGIKFKSKNKASSLSIGCMIKSLNSMLQKSKDLKKKRIYKH